MTPCATKQTSTPTSWPARGVPVQHFPVKGAVHGFLSFTGSVQLSRTVLNQLSRAVAEAFN